MVTSTVVPIRPLFSDSSQFRKFQIPFWSIYTSSMFSEQHVEAHHIIFNFTECQIPFKRFSPIYPIFSNTILGWALLTFHVHRHYIDGLRQTFIMHILLLPRAVPAFGLPKNCTKMNRRPSQQMTAIAAVLVYIVRKEWKQKWSTDVINSGNYAPKIQNWSKYRYIICFAPRINFSVGRDVQINWK